MENDDYDLKAYTQLWEEKVLNLVSVLGTAVDKTENEILISYELVYAPLIHKVKIEVFKNGKVTVWKSEIPFMADKSEVTFLGQLDVELLNEIITLTEQESLKNQKSCFEVVKDGFSTTLMLYLKNGLKIISNHNCKKSDFSLAYQQLDFLLSLIIGTIQNEDKH